MRSIQKKATAEKSTCSGAKQCESCESLFLQPQIHENPRDEEKKKIREDEKGCDWRRDMRL